jgi:hypothetical protein
MSIGLKDDIITDWRLSSRNNRDMYTQIVRPMSGIEYLYFTNFLLLLYRNNNGKICDELVNEYLLADIEHRTQLRLAEKEKRRAYASAGASAYASAGASAYAREEMQKIEKSESIMFEDEKRRLEDEKRRLEDEKRRLENDRRLKNEKELEKERLQAIADFINVAACELDPGGPSSPSNQLLLFADSDQLSEKFCVYIPHSV